MKLRKSEYQGDLYYENKYFFTHPYRMDILDNKDKCIGEITGHIINTDIAAYDRENYNGKDFFYELDSLSELLCECHGFISQKISLERLKQLHNIIFLNRLSLYKEYRSKENEKKALELLFNHAEMVIYSYGSTELDDDFPTDEEDSYYDNYEDFLELSGWNFDETFNFYVKEEKHKWTHDKILKRIHEPFKKVKLTRTNFAFWQWLFSDAKEISVDNVFMFKNDDDEYSELLMLASLFYYNYTKSKLANLDLWNSGSLKNENIELSPFSLFVFLDYIDDLKSERTEDSGVWVSFNDENIEKNIDKILNKYHKMIHEFSAIVNLNIIYIPMIEKYLKEINHDEAENIYNTFVKDKKY